MMATDTSLIQPKITAEQALLRLLELIRTSKSIADFTPEQVGEVMEVPIAWANDGVKRFGYGASLTPHWNIGFGVDRTKGTGRFELFIDANPPGTYQPMTDICQLDFDHFTAALEAMGFSRSHHYDSPPSPPIGQAPLPHGRLMYDSFDRPGMGIEVYPRGETNEKANHACVKWVFIY